jgi:hypothetical protein
VAALNQRRRSRINPLTQEEERAKAEAAIREHPEWTDRRIAEACGVSDPFVTKVRTEVSSGNVTPWHRNAALWRGRRRKRPYIGKGGCIQRECMAARRARRQCATHRVA